MIQFGDNDLGSNPEADVSRFKFSIDLAIEHCKDELLQTQFKAQRSIL